MNYKKTLKDEIKKAVDIARDLYYSKAVIENLKSAQSEAEIEQILNGARRRN